MNIPGAKRIPDAARKAASAVGGGARKVGDFFVKKFQRKPEGPFQCEYCGEETNNGDSACDTCSSMFPSGDTNPPESKTETIISAVGHQASKIKETVMSPFRTARKEVTPRIVSKDEKIFSEKSGMFYRTLQGLSFAAFIAFSYFMLKTYSVDKSIDYALFLPMFGIIMVFRFASKQADKYTKAVDLFFSQNPEGQQQQTTDYNE